MRDEDVIEALRGDVKTRSVAIRYLCKHKDLTQSISGYVLKNGGGHDEVKMILTDVIMAFAKKVFFKKEFKLEIGLVEYIYGMARYKWLDELKRKGKAIVTEEFETKHEQINAIPFDDLLIKGERSELIKQVLSKMGKNCKEVLMYWAGSSSMKEIAELLGYQSEGMVRKKKSNCLKELRTYFEQQPLLKSQLIG